MCKVRKNRHFLGLQRTHSEWKVMNLSKLHWQAMTRSLNLYFVKRSGHALSLDTFNLQVGPRRSSASQRNRLPTFSSQKKLKEEVS